MNWTKHYFSWSKVPYQHKTEKQILKLHRRLKKDAQVVGKITLIFDKPRSRPKYVDPVPTDECEQIRKKLAWSGPDGSGYDLYRLDQAGQLATMNLYDLSDTVEIKVFTEKEATKLLEYMVWDHSHEDHYITEATIDGERQRATWKSEVSVPDLTSHLEGNRYFGVKKGRMTMQVTADCDRHGGDVPGNLHITKTLKMGKVLTQHFPDYRFAPEINPKNGSVKFFGWLPEFKAMPTAEKIGEDIRQTLQSELPEYNFDALEIYPCNSPQIFAPLRADKITVINTGVVNKVQKYHVNKTKAGRKRHYYQTYSCADFINWIYFSDDPYNETVFEQHLREAVARCPDTDVINAKTPVNKPKTTKASSPGGMGNIGKLKGRCASTLVRFWTELDVPEDDTIGKYVIVTLRILKYEGLDRDEAVAWIEDRLQALKYTEFSDRLTDNFGELQRVMAYAVDAVWENNGYQKDPVLSDSKLTVTVDAWYRRGFYLHDPSTWNKHKGLVVPDLNLIWTPMLLGLIPELAALAHTTPDKAKLLIEKVMAFVESNNELAESMVGNLLEDCGINGRSRQKQHDVRKFLVEKGLLVKQKNYFSDKATGYRHGNFYTCSLEVRFEEEPPPQGTHTVSIYLSLNIVSGEETEADLLDFVLEKRRLACEWRYRERVRQLKLSFRAAA